MTRVQPEAMTPECALIRESQPLVTALTAVALDNFGIAVAVDSIFARQQIATPTLYRFNTENTAGDSLFPCQRCFVTIRRIQIFEAITKSLRLRWGAPMLNDAVDK